MSPLRSAIARTSVLAALMLLASCSVADTLTEGFAHGQAVSDRLEKSIGNKSTVGFQWNNGALTSVTVSFEGIPKGQSVERVVMEAKDAVLAEFKQSPQAIVVSFRVAP